MSYRLARTTFRTPRRMSRRLLWASPGVGASTLTMFDVVGGNNAAMTNMEIVDWSMSTTLGRWIVNFGGTNEYAVTANPVVPVGDFTITAWVNTSYLGAEGQQLVSQWASGETGRMSWFISTANVQRLYLSGASVASGAATIGTGLWVNVAVSRVGSTIQLWAGGVADGSAASSSTAIHQCPMSIGCYGAGTGEFLTGYIADVMVWDGALTQPELQWIANPDNRLTEWFSDDMPTVAGLSAAAPASTYLPWLHGLNGGIEVYNGGLS